MKKSGGPKVGSARYFLCLFSFCKVDTESDRGAEEGRDEPVYIYLSEGQ